jgi:hypothetical protein
VLKRNAAELVFEVVTVMTMKRGDVPCSAVGNRNMLLSCKKAQSLCLTCVMTKMYGGGC